MPRRSDLDEDTLLRRGFSLLGVTLWAIAALAFDFAQDHMAALGELCGAGAHAHCGWCYAAAGFAAAGFAALVPALRPAAAKQRALDCGRSRRGGSSRRRRRADRPTAVSRARSTAAPSYA